MKFIQFLGSALTFGLLSSVAPSSAATADEAQFLSHTRQLTFEGRRSGEGYFSPDGKSLIFQSEREPGNPFYQIYLLDFETGDTHRVSPGVGKTTCSFFRPGNDEVLFASTHLDSDSLAKQKAELEFRAAGKQRRYSWDYDEQMDIFLAKRDGSNLRRLTNARGYDAEASFSPDGKLIAFCSLRDAYPTNKLSPAELKHLETDPSWFGEIYLMRADGSRVRRLTHTPGYDGGPFFSPDGKRIVWRRFTERGDTADVFTMALDGSDQRRLTDFHAMSWAPYFHPSGRYLIFTANKLGFGNFELFLVDSEGAKEPVRVTFTDGFDGLPVFSPDGTKLCWTSSRTPDGKSQLFLADWNDVAALEALQAAPPRQTGTPEPTTQTQPANARAEPAPSPAALPSSLVNESRHAFSAAITSDDLHSVVAFLASDELAGRMSGSAGAAAAAEYIANQMRRIGLKPAGTNASLFQSYEFSTGARIVSNANQLQLVSRQGVSTGFELERDFRPLAFTANAEVRGELVFAGYGLAVPGKPGEGYDSYTGLNVSNRIAVVLRYVPEQAEPKRRADLNRYAGVRYKAMLAREHGAKGVIFITGPNSPNAGEMLGLSSDSSLSGSGIAIASAGSNFIATIFADCGHDLTALQTALDQENPHAETGFVFTNVTAVLRTGVEPIRRTDRNVLGMIPPGTDSTGGKEYVLVGAHYDHLGHGESGAMNRKGEEGMIHPGADDNASGVATVLELADALASDRAAHPENFPRGIIFATWSGEEIGLIGSSWFAEHPPLPLTNIIAYLNFDMVGRLRDNKLTLQGVGSSPAWTRLIEKRNVAAGFNLALQDDPYLPTDTTALYPKGVPVLAFFTGSHDDYHRPTDKADTLNYAGAERVARFARSLLLDLETGERPGYAQVARKDAGQGSREAMRAYLGTIPDYAAEVQGVKLSGVRAGGPADKAGLKGGDVIVEFGATKIANIYDYTYAMDAVKIGQPVAVVVMRNGERISLLVTPEARK